MATTVAHFDDQNCNYALPNNRIDLGLVALDSHKNFASFLAYLKSILNEITNIICCVRQDGTRFDIKCAFNYSDNLVIINQVTPVTIQNKNHLEIIQIRTQIKLVIW